MGVAYEVPLSLLDVFTLFFPVSSNFFEPGPRRSSPMIQKLSLFLIGRGLNVDHSSPGPEGCALMQKTPYFILAGKLMGKCIVRCRSFDAAAKIKIRFFEFEYAFVIADSISGISVSNPNEIEMISTSALIASSIAYQCVSFRSLSLIHHIPMLLFSESFWFLYRPRIPVRSRGLRCG